MNLYFVTAYHWKANEWWRFAISAETDDAAIAKFKDGYDDKFSRINAAYVCTTSDDVFKEL
jgi:hypothetical protein